MDTQVKYGGFWIRVVASIIDTIITSILGMAIGGLFGFAIGYSMADSGLDSYEIETVAGLIGQLLGAFIGFVYFCAFESSKMQGTLGKRAVGLKVTDLDGNRISFGRASGRYFSKIISAILLFIGFMMVGWTQKKQGLHDKIAGTLVIKDH